MSKQKHSRIKKNPNPIKTIATIKTKKTTQTIINLLKMTLKLETQVGQNYKNKI